LFYAAYYLLLNLFGIVKGSEAFIIGFFKDPTVFYLIGRILTGFLPSMASIYLTYVLASRFFSKKAALYASLMMSVVFLNVTNSHYIYTDNLLVMFSLAAYVSGAILMKEPLLKNYLLFGSLVGIAIAVKYNAALLVVPFILSGIFTENRKPDILKIFCGLIAMITAFVIFNPFSVLDLKFFLSSVPGKIRHGYIGWSHHMVYSLFEGIGMASTIAGITGLLMAIKRNMRAGLFLCSFPVVFYLHLVFKSQPFSRYVLVLVPFLSVGAGFLFYDHFYKMSKSRTVRVIVIMLSFMTVIPSVVKSVKADMLFSGKDTRAQSAEWISENLPDRTKIALDSTFFCPRLKQTLRQLREKEAISRNQPELTVLKTRKLDYQIKAHDDKNSYETWYIIDGSEATGVFMGSWPVVMNNLDALRKEGIGYVVLNSMVLSEKFRSFQDEIASSCELVLEFSPYKKTGLRRSYDEIETTCIPVTSKELFSRSSFGPYIRIYKVK
jgi:hypothetical protein